MCGLMVLKEQDNDHDSFGLIHNSCHLEMLSYVVQYHLHLYNCSCTFNCERTEHECNASELQIIEVTINVKGIVCITNEECFSVEG